MHFERWAFAQALMDYFAHAAPKHATPSDIIGAMGLDAEAYRAAQQHHEGRLLAEIAVENYALATEFAEIFSRARAHLRATKPTLDDLRESTRLAAPPAPPVTTDGVDETALLPVFVPSVIVPFGGPKTAAKAVPASAPLAPPRTAHIAPPVVLPAGADETVVAPPRVALKPALPFVASKDVDPKKGSR